MLMDSTTVASPEGAETGRRKREKVLLFFFQYSSCDWFPFAAAAAAAAAATSSFGAAPSALWDRDFPAVRIKLHLLS